MLGGLLHGVWGEVTVGGCALSKGPLETQRKDGSPART